MDEFSAQVTALEKAVVGRDAECAQHLNKCAYTTTGGGRAQQNFALDQVHPSGTTVVQPVWPCEVLALVI